MAAYPGPLIQPKAVRGFFLSLFRVGDPAPGRGAASTFSQHPAPQQPLVEGDKQQNHRQEQTTGSQQVEAQFAGQQQQADSLRQVMCPSQVFW